MFGGEMKTADQIERSPVRPERIAGHGEKIRNHQTPEAGVAQHAPGSERALVHWRPYGKAPVEKPPTGDPDKTATAGEDKRPLPVTAPQSPGTDQRSHERRDTDATFA